MTTENTWETNWEMNKGVSVTGEAGKKEIVKDWKTDILYFTSPYCLWCKQQWPVFDYLKQNLSSDYWFKVFDVSTEEWMKEAVDNRIMVTPTIVVRYSYQATKKNKWFIDKEFKWIVSQEDIIKYINHGK
jgi:hypothetical protein